MKSLLSNRLQKLLASMQLEEKIGQMTQVEKNSISPEDIKKYAIGSVLSGGGGNPEVNSPATWQAMVHAYQAEALQTRLGIPILYGSDAVHGHNNVKGATIFPHNIGLGAAQDADLVQRIASITAIETAATGVHWTFAPALSLAQDIRWGRSYEGYAQEPEAIANFAKAFITGLEQGNRRAPEAILACAKHYIADGATMWGSSKRIDRERILVDKTLENAEMSESMAMLLEKGAWMIDQGDALISEATIRSHHLPLYQAAIEAGALSVMASYSSINGAKMHGHHYWLTSVLKEELGFKGFIVTDWEGVDQLDDDYYRCVVQSINAGIDMVMVPFDYKRFIDCLSRAVVAKDVALERIDDAVARILYVKEQMGLFEYPYAAPERLADVGSAAHRAVAREAVRKTATLLKNDANLLPLKQTQSVRLMGEAADSIGHQCGGWTVSWMGEAGAVTSGTTLRQALKQRLGEAKVTYDPEARATSMAEVGVLVLAEEPYAEGMGDRHDLALSETQKTLLARARASCHKLIVILFSGRPRIITEELTSMDAFIAAWLPGSEAGEGLADVLWGDYPFTAKLHYHWPVSMTDIPLTPTAKALFPLGVQ